MRFLRFMANLWPGFSRAWVLGRFEGLALAATFSVVLNGALVSVFIWRDRPLALSPLAVAGWAGLLMLGLWALGRWHMPPIAAIQRAGDNPDETSETPRTFAEAQREYLQGHWLEAEMLVAELLASNPSDVEARLLAASIQRRTQRYTEAKKTLTRLRADNQAVRWLLEIETELRALEELEREVNPPLVMERNAA